MTLLAATSWPDAMVAVAGIALITVITVVVVIQLAATWRARVSVAREDGYRQQLARDLPDA